MKTKFLLLFSILFFAACSSRQERTASLPEDAVYKYMDLKKTTDMSTENSVFKELDSLQKRQLLPDISKGLSMDVDFPYSSLVDVYFVAKQKKIGTLQPILLKLNGDDFNKTILINLNEENHPVSFLFVAGEEFCGSDHDFYCEKSTHSIFNNEEIITYDLVKTESSNNDDTSYTDSIVYKSIIKPDGTIETNKIDSVRITKK